MSRIVRRSEWVAWGIAAAMAAAVIAILAGVIEGGPINPPGPPASTDSVRLPGTPISSVPLNITAPGHYYLTRDLTFAAPGTALLITADDVDLDLGGFRLRGANNVGIAVNAGRTRVRLYNGGVTGFAVGILQNADAANTVVTVEDLVVSDTTGNALNLQENAGVRGVTVTRAGGAGMIVGPNSSVSGAIVGGAVNFGIDAGANSAVRDCQVNQVSGGAAGQAALRVGNDSTVERCLVVSNQSAGIRGGTGVIVSNSSAFANSGGDAIGINVGASSTVINSSARINASAGINAGNYSVIEACVANLNGAAGVVVGARSIVRGCSIESNGTDGIAAGSSAGVVIERNAIGFNQGHGISAGAGVRILDNTLRGNNRATAGTTDGAAINLTNTISHVEGNLIVGNDVGILSTSGNNTIVRNVAYENAGGNYNVQADDLDGVLISLANVGTDTHAHYNYAP